MFLDIQEEWPQIVIWMRNVQYLLFFSLYSLHLFVCSSSLFFLCFLFFLYCTDVWTWEQEHLFWLIIRTCISLLPSLFNTYVWMYTCTHLQLFIFFLCFHQNMHLITASFSETVYRRWTRSCSHCTWPPQSCFSGDNCILYVFYLTWISLSILWSVPISLIPVSSFTQNSKEGKNFGGTTTQNYLSSSCLKSFKRTQMNLHAHTNAN